MEFPDLRLVLGFIVLLIITYGASILYLILTQIKRTPSIMKKLNITIEGTDKFLYGLSKGIIAVGLFTALFCYFLARNLQTSYPVHNDRIIAVAIIGIFNILQFGIGIKLFINNRSKIKSKP
ncbi:MAG: hypothetical protein JSV49_09635 [Thermoplasmata archaeon]|nr:MAG: hypothetical protein JSV49_09635 [Thermoplasmata archaeon]